MGHVTDTLHSEPLDAVATAVGFEWRRHAHLEQLTGHFQDGVLLCGHRGHLVVDNHEHFKCVELGQRSQSRVFGRAIRERHYKPEISPPAVRSTIAHKVFKYSKVGLETWLCDWIVARDRIYNPDRRPFSMR